MKDKDARQSIEDLRKWITERINQQNANFSFQVDGMRVKMATLENKQIAREAEEVEAAIPVCKTCGQKIQNGFKPGDISKIMAAAKK